jgi:hypothetical protein
MNRLLRRPAVGLLGTLALLTAASFAHAQGTVAGPLGASVGSAALLDSANAQARQLSDSEGRSVSYSFWNLDGQRVTLRFILPASETQRVTGTDIAVLRTTRFGEYLLDHVAVRAAGQPCPAIDQGFDIGKVDPLTVGANLDGFEVFFQCPSLQDVTLEDRALFGRLPGQVNFARLQINGGPVSEQLFTPSHQQLHLASLTAVSSASFSRYVALGIGHVLGGLDRLCFLLAALLLVRQARQLGALVGALAAGYALSLPIALYAPIMPRSTLLDAFIGFLVAMLAFQLMTRQLVRVRLAGTLAAGALLILAVIALIAHAGAPVLLLAGAGLVAAALPALGSVSSGQMFTVPVIGGLFAVLDGFILPAALQPMQLPAATRLPMLVGFDLGAWALESVLLVAAVLAASLWTMARRRGRPQLRALATDAAAAAIGGLGVFWLISRL